MTTSEANYQKVLSLIRAQDEQMLQANDNDKKRPALKRGKQPISRFKQLSFFDRRDRIQLNDL
jgi:hypothetical protein